MHLIHFHSTCMTQMEPLAPEYLKKILFNFETPNAGMQLQRINSNWLIGNRDTRTDRQKRGGIRGDIFIGFLTLFVFCECLAKRPLFFLKSHFFFSVWNSASLLLFRVCKLCVYLLVQMNRQGGLVGGRPGIWCSRQGTKLTCRVAEWTPRWLKKECHRA